MSNTTGTLLRPLSAKENAFVECYLTTGDKEEAMAFSCVRHKTAESMLADERIQRALELAHDRILGFSLNAKKATIDYRLGRLVQTADMFYDDFDEAKNRGIKIDHALKSIDMMNNMCGTRLNSDGGVDIDAESSEVTTIIDDNFKREF